MADASAPSPIEQQLQCIIRECQDQQSSTVQELQELTALALARSVARNSPFVVRGYGTELACSRWSRQSLIERVQGDLDVASSPYGLADAIYHDHFVEPLTERMSMAAFLDRLADKTLPPCYFQAQDNNLHLPELSSLLDDVGADVPAATEVFGSPPDATNLWIGDERSTTSLHKDPYENLYLCVRGSKTFTLFPPTEFYALHERLYRPARWTRSDDEWKIEPADPSVPDVPWLAVDPFQPDLDAFPRFSYARAITLTLRAGDLLYLPALWFHAVQQTGDPLAIAVNWWYDMSYESPVWALHRLVRGLTLALNGRTEAEDL